MADDKPKFISVKRVMLGPHHLSPGRTQHSIVDKNGKRPFPSFKSLEIAQFPGDEGYYLLHICADGQVADTHHGSMDDALHQAEWELGVQPHEWIDISEQFGRQK